MGRPMREAEGGWEAGDRHIEGFPHMTWRLWIRRCMLTWSLDVVGVCWLQWLKWEAQRLLVLCYCESKETAIEQPVGTAEGTKGKDR